MALFHLEQAQVLYRQRDFLRAYDSYKRAEIASDYLVPQFNSQHCLRQFAMSCGFAPPVNMADVRIACILDGFSWQCFSPEANCMALHPASALAELASFSPQILFVESAWRGDNDMWAGKVSPAPSDELIAVVNWCRERRVLTLFWDKEGRNNFDQFIKSAILFDFIFTTDLETVGDYKREAGHERVFLLPMACQPRLHNPIALPTPRESSFCFAGSWYKRFPERGHDIRSLIRELSGRMPFVIYDRNYGIDSAATNWPEDLRKFIKGGLPYAEIAKAYKGYQFGICINTAKQSQTMFARRVFELMASNTIVIANYARALKVFFGDLAIVSDNPREIKVRLDTLSELDQEKIRLRALRKVLSQHTYRHRLAQIIKCCFGYDAPAQQPEVLCVAFADSKVNLERALANYERQTYAAKSLLIVASSHAAVCCRRMSDHPDIKICDENAPPPASAQNVWIACLHTDDWYGAEYLTDLLLATTYTDAPCIGKADYWKYKDGALERMQANMAYQANATFAPRCAILRGPILNAYATIDAWRRFLTSPGSCLTGQAVDAFNYCRDGAECTQATLNMVTYAAPLSDEGLPITELMAAAQQWSRDEPVPAAKRLEKYEICSQLELPPGSWCSVVNGPYNAEIDSHVPPGKNVVAWTKKLSVDKFKSGAHLRPFIPIFPEAGMKWQLRQLDKQGNLLAESPVAPNTFAWIKLAAGASWFKLGIDVHEAGNWYLSPIEFERTKRNPALLLSNADYLLIAPQYPDYDDYYRLGFIHSRVRLYRQAGLQVDVFLLNWNREVSFREFQGINVISGDPAFLERIISAGKYKKILIHFLGREAWNVVSRFPLIPKLIWIHGAEIQPWFRRIFNFPNEQELKKAKDKTSVMFEFWPEVFAHEGNDCNFVFVSETFKNEVCADYGVERERANFHVVPNPIDMNLFQYHDKPVSQRHKVLMVHSFSTPKYANDLAVKCILHMARHPDFRDFEFMIVGSGRLFSELTQPLAKFSNVTLVNRYIAQEDIARLHKDYGIFLIPTRRDSQGVSRDEAMASGLVPVTNSIDSIPEFVDESCAILAPAEDYVDMAMGIRKLGASPELFEKMSRSAWERVSTRRMDITTGAEIRLITGEISGDSAGNAAAPDWTECNAVEVGERKARVSVIMPCFNTAPYISRAIASCLGQSVRDLELLVYDDASSDGTLDVVQALAAEEPRIKVFAGDVNRGQGYGRNYLLARAAGEYVMFLDSDDYYNDAQFFEQLCGMAEDNQADIVVSPYLWGKDGRLTSSPLEERVYGDYSAAGYYLSRKFNTHGMSGKLFSRQCLLGAKFVEYGYSEDVIFGLTTFLKARNVVTTNVSSYVYYLDNVSSCRPTQMRLIHFYSSLRLLAEIMTEWFKAAHKGSPLDILGFLHTWKKDHLPRLLKILSEKHIPETQKAFIFDKFHFLHPFLVGLGGYALGWNFIMPQRAIEPDPAYEHYRLYLAGLMRQFNDYFYISEINGENRLFVRFQADSATMNFMRGQVESILGGCFTLEPFQPRECQPYSSEIREAS